MTMVSFGDLAQAFVLRSQSARLKSETTRLSQELASGRHSDIGGSLRGDHGRLTALSHSRSLTAGYQSAAGEAAFRTGAMQAVFTTIGDSAGDLAPDLLAIGDGANQLTLIAANAGSRLSAALSALNSTAGGRSLFAGVATDRPAMADATVMLDALRAEMAGVTDAATAMARIDAWFADPAGYVATMYLGDAETGLVAVSADDRIWAGPTAADPAIAATLKGFATAALLQNGGLALSNSAQADLARLAGESLVSGQTRLTGLAAQVGISEARIENARARNAAELLALEMAQAEMVNADPLRTATELEAVQTSLETVYTLTARLSRLTLTDLLR